MKSILFTLSLLVSNVLFAQHKWSPFAGIGLLGDAGMEFVGVGFTAGAIKPIGKDGRWQITPELQYFRKYSDWSYSSGMTETNKFTSIGARVNMNKIVGRAKNPKTGFIMGLGLGIQHADRQYDIYNKVPNSIDESLAELEDGYAYTRLMGSFNLGYSFGIGKDGNHNLQFVLNGIGPYVETHGFSQCIEILSTVGLHTRFVF